MTDSKEIKPREIIPPEIDIHKKKLLSDFIIPDTIINENKIKSDPNQEALDIAQRHADAPNDVQRALIKAKAIKHFSERVQKLVDLSDGKKSRMAAAGQVHDQISQFVEASTSPEVTKESARNLYADAFAKVLSESIELSKQDLPPQDKNPEKIPKLSS